MAALGRKPTMNIGVLRFDRTAAFIDGRVRADYVNVINTPGGRTSVEGLLNGSLDAADVPLARYVFWKHQGRPITGIPVFTDRLFQHEYIYTRSDTGIASLADLRGRRVGCAPSYFATPSFWHRALLREEAGIAPHEIEWHSAGEEADGMRIPDGVTVTVSPDTLLGLNRLLDGTVDALMTARTARIPENSRHIVKRVIPDASERQRSWVKKTGYFPIVHIFAIRDQALAARPSLGEELCRAFDELKDRAYRLLQDERMTALPLMRGYLDDTVALCGDDPWPYGVERNRDEIGRFLGYAHEQGLTSRCLGVDELFDERSAAYTFNARMTSGCITGIMDGGWAPEPTY